MAYRTEAGCAVGARHATARSGLDVLVGSLMSRSKTLPTEEKFGQPLKMNETETLCNGQWLRLKRRGRWEFAERVNAGGGVIIVAVTPEDRLLLVEQYRAAIECEDDRNAGRASSAISRTRRTSTRSKRRGASCSRKPATKPDASNS